MIKERKPLGYDKIKDKRVVLLQSGGLDSNVIASIFNYFGFEMHHVFVNYGQNMLEKEREYSKKIADFYGGTYQEVTINLPWLKETTNLVDNNVTEYHKENAEYMDSVTIENTYVPLRNHMLVSIACSLAEGLNIPYVACAFDGAEDENHKPLNGVPDKHPTFVSKIEDSVNEGSSMYQLQNKRITILTPVMDLFKEEIIGLGLATGADMSISWSCYNKSEKPCGLCSACKTRREAFNTLEIQDPYYN